MGRVIRLYPAEERVGETEDRLEEISSMKHGRTNRKYFQNKCVGDIVYIVKRRSIICLIEDPERKKRKNGEQAIFEETMTKCFPEMTKNINLHICET